MFEYFRKREIFFIAFLAQNNKTPKCINRSLFVFSLSIIFIINCFFFDESLVHKRYLNALKGKSNKIAYFFKNEFKISIYTALISNIIKMVFIKILINWIFKIDDTEIKKGFEEGLNKNDLEDLKNKYYKDYFRKTIIYFIILFIINIFIAYVCMCYGDIFSNSYWFFILSFLASNIISFLFCMILCFLIIISYIIWKKTHNLIALAAYILLSRLY